MILNIKNMVCDRCIMVIRQQLEQLNFKIGDIFLGGVEILPDPSESQISQISSTLKVLGFEMIDSEKDKLIDRIRTLIIETIHHTDEPELHINFTELLAQKLNKDYAYLSRLFSESEDSTIEKFIIQQKIEKVKELLQYGQLNLNEIAYKMGYSSSAHLSTQFKGVTGLTPSQFKASAHLDRKALDKV